MLVQYLYRLASQSEGVSLAILPFVNIISVTSNQSKGAAQQISTASFNRNISLILPIRENNFLKQHSETFCYLCGIVKLCTQTTLRSRSTGYTEIWVLLTLTNGN